MSEETNTTNFANRPRLDKTPQKPNPEADYAKKDSAFNSDVVTCAQWLKDNKDKAGSDEYMQNLNALQSLADKNYPMAQFEYSKYLADQGALQSAALWHEKAATNANAGPELRQEIGNKKPGDSAQLPGRDVAEIERYLEAHKDEKDNEDYKRVEDTLRDMAEKQVPGAARVYEKHTGRAIQTKEEEEQKKENAGLSRALADNSVPKESFLKRTMAKCLGIDFYDLNQQNQHQGPVRKLLNHVGKSLKRIVTGRS